MNKKTFIIAEAGANHNRSLKQALVLIDVAHQAGADAVKFQTYSSETLYAKNTPNFAGYKNINKLIKEIELPREWQKDLKAHCDGLGIEFMSTPFDERAVDELVSLGVKRLKIAGFESTDPRFVKMVASSGLPLIISAGIGNNLESVSNIISWVSSEQSDPDLTVLHCNNAYPTPDEDIHLERIRDLKDRYPNIKVGLSDHTTGILAPSLAVAYGASCIEKHFTLSKSLPGPDHPFALEPVELAKMISQIRKAETMCERGNLSITTSERGFKSAMRSVVTTRPLKKGEILTVDNMTTKRPWFENTIPARNFYDLLGQRVNTNLEQDVSIERGQIINE